MNRDEIPTIFFEKSYYAIPEAGAEEAFELLRLSLMQKGKIAIAQTVLGSKETLLAIMPTEEGMLIQSMFFADEIRALPKTYVKPAVSEEQLKLAGAIIDTLDTPFEPAAYHEEFQLKIRKLIEQKRMGQEVVAVNQTQQEGNILDLMSALQASLKEQELQPAAKSKPRTRKKTQPSVKAKKSVGA